MNFSIFKPSLRLSLSISSPGPPGEASARGGEIEGEMNWGRWGEGRFSKLPI